MESSLIQCDRVKVEVPDYHVLAHIYNSVMSHVDYSSWAQFAIAILNDHGLPSTSGKIQPYLLECACGTGIISTAFALYGCKIDANDKSPEMIKIARNRAAKLDNPPNYSIMDFLKLDYTNRYDAVICLYDSVNYLMELRDLISFFRRVKKALKPMGLYLFDICTEFNSKQYFSSSEINDVGEGFSYKRKSRFLKHQMIQENVFYINLDDHPGKTFIETHQQRIYTVDMIRDVLAETGFNLLEESDNISRITPTTNSLRIHFLCQSI